VAEAVLGLSWACAEISLSGLFGPCSKMVELFQRAFFEWRSLNDVLVMPSCAVL
jgi:hypothetical protein